MSHRANVRLQTGLLPSTSQCIERAQKWHKRPANQLISLQSNENYTWLLWRTGERVLLPRTLKYIEDRLPAGQFLRLRRDRTVNLDYIERIDHLGYSCMVVRLKTGEHIEVARRRIMDVRRQLQQHPMLAQYVG